MSKEKFVTQENFASFQSQMMTEIRTLLNSDAAKPEKRWIKTFQLKQMIPMSDTKLQQLRGNGQLPCSIVDGLAYYDMDDVIAFMNKAKTLSRKNRKYGINRKEDVEAQ